MMMILFGLQSLPGPLGHLHLGVLGLVGAGYGGDIAIAPAVLLSVEAAVGVGVDDYGVVAVEGSDLLVGTVEVHNGRRNVEINRQNTKVET